MGNSSSSRANAESIAVAKRISSSGSSNEMKRMFMGWQSHCNHHSRHSMKQIVVVEDNHAIRRALESWLIEAGYDVVSSVRFEDARAYLASHTPDILLTDVK